MTTNHILKILYITVLVAVLSAATELFFILTLREFLSTDGTGSTLIPNIIVKLILKASDVFGMTFFVVFIITILMFMKLANLFTATLLAFRAQEILSYIRLKYHFQNEHELLDTEPSSLQASIVNKTNILAFYYYLPIANIISNTTLLSVLLISILLIDLLLSIFIISIIGGMYILLMVISNKSLKNISYIINSHLDEKNRLTMVSSSAYLDIFNNNSRLQTLEQFRKNENTLAGAIIKSQLISFGPRFVIESIGFVVLVVVFVDGLAPLGVTINNNEINILVILFALSRCLPAAQQIFSSFAALKVGKDTKTEFDKYLKTYGKPATGPLIPTLQKGMPINYAFEKKDNQKYEISFKIGDKVLITGPSGSGKTILVQGFCQIGKYQGNITVNGLCLSTQGSKEAWHNEYEYMSQSYALISDNFVQKRIKENRSQLTSIFEMLDLDMKEIESLGRLSGGQKQRAVVALKLISERQILIFDEPTSSLDPINANRVWSLLQKIDKTVVVITHNNLNTSGFAKVVEL